MIELRCLYYLLKSNTTSMSSFSCLYFKGEAPFTFTLGFFYNTQNPDSL